MLYRKWVLKICCAIFPSLVVYVVLVNKHFNDSYLTRQTKICAVPISPKSSHPPQCEWPPPGLRGRQNISHDVIPMSDLQDMFPYMWKGRAKPSSCTSQQRIAIIVPYRDREQQLRGFLLNVVPKLRRQNIDFTIYIVEQSPDGRFNRGMMRNIGFREADSEHTHDCYVFHDVDVIPEDDRNVYFCGDQPRHLSALMDRHKYKLLYKNLVGGIIAMTREHFIDINGYSNQFFCWGGEDDDLQRRIAEKKLKIDRPNRSYAQCSGITHEKASKKSTERYDILKSIVDMHEEDGLNSLEYDILRQTYRKLYRWIYLKINETKIVEKRNANPKFQKRHKELMKKKSEKQRLNRKKIKTNNTTIKFNL